MAGQKEPARVGYIVKLGLPLLLVFIVWARCFAPRDKRDAPQASANGSGQSGHVATSAPSATAHAPSSSGSASTSAASAAESAFEKLWAGAVDPDPKKNLDAVVSLAMARQDFCAAYEHRCGDEFTRDAAWKAVQDEAKEIRAAVYRESIPAEKIGFISGREGFKIGEFVPSTIELPIEVEWPRGLGGKEPRRTSCAPRRPSVSRLGMPNGEAANTWETFKSTELSVRFGDAAAAKAWKQRDDNPAVLRIVYKVLSATSDSHKETASGITLDSGAGGLVLVQILGAQLREGDSVLAEKPPSK